MMKVRDSRYQGVTPNSVRLCFFGNACSIHVASWASQLAEIGYSVEVVSWTQVPEKPAGFRVHYVPYSLKSWPTSLWRLRAITGRLRPDIVHGIGLTAAGILAAFSGARPVVLSAEGSDILVSSYRHIIGRIIRAALRRATCVNAVSRQVARRLVELGVGREKIIVFPKGVDLDLVQPCSRGVRNLSRIVSTRSLEPVYNVEQLVRAVPKVVEYRPDCRFFIVGEGSCRGSLEKLASELGVSRWITFLGRIRHEQVINVLSEAGIYVSTSLSDGTSVSLLEAMASGTLPVVSDIAANREWIRDGFNGYLFPCGCPDALAEQLLTALQTGMNLDALAHCNYEIVKESASKQFVLQQLQAMYARCLGDLPA